MTKIFRILGGGAYTTGIDFLKGYYNFYIKIKNFKPKLTKKINILKYYIEFKVFTCKKLKFYVKTQNFF